MNLKEITLSVNKVAEECAAFIRKEAETFKYSMVELKGKNDLVSYVDKEAEKLIVSHLKTILPEAGFITEEGTEKPSDTELTWIIDPLDGTTNFIHGFPFYSVSIALARGNELLSGVVYDVQNKFCFYAWKDGGAYLNEESINVSQQKSISESLFATGFPYYNFERMDQYLGILNELMKNAHGLRRLGSAALDLAYTALGRFEGYFEYNLNSYDVAAGALIVIEAGGHVTDFSGGDNFLFGREIVAGNQVQPELLATIQKLW